MNMARRSRWELTYVIWTRRGGSKTGVDPGVGSAKILRFYTNLV